MIDLRNKGLPDAIEVDGKPFLINTDFRDWLKFGEIIESRAFRMWVDLNFAEIKEISFYDFLFLFKNEMPMSNFVPKLIEFYINQNVTPNDSGCGKSDVRPFDYILDGEYIVGSFMQAYQIDLTEVEHMHWHMFKALFLSLPENTKIKEIMSMRVWNERDEKRDYKEQKRKLREAWTLPENNIDENEILEEINNDFYGAV